MKKKEKIYNKTKLYLQSINDKDINKKMKKLEKLLEISNRKELYSSLYDELCDYLDDYFYNKNICEFKCNICGKRRLKNNPNENGCCYSLTKKKLCKYLVSGRCSIRCLACKLYICSYLRSKGYNFNLDNIYLSKYTLNRVQKYYLTHKFFLPKEKILKSILFI